MKVYLRALITLVLCILSCAADAIPAKKGLVKFVQPTGEFINVLIYGDEYGHYYQAPDGFPLVENEGFLYYADEIDGHLVTSNFIYNNDGIDSLCNAFLKSRDRIRLSYLNKECATKRWRSASTKSNFGLFPSVSFPSMGEQRSIVILVEFPDVKFNQNYDAKDYFNRLLNESGFSDLGSSGSVRDYFLDNSNGKFNPTFDLYGPIRLTKPSVYYGANTIHGNDANPAQMIIEACKQLDETVDFSLYDRDNDGFIDNVFVFYAGRGEASGGGPATIWPHSWDVNNVVSAPIILDEKKLGRYACSNEWFGTQPDGIGTFIHEFCHVLGLPDLYATSYSNAFTPGPWSVMDQGSYNNNSRTPPHLSVFERYALGWASPVRLDSGILNLEPITESDGYMFVSDSGTEKWFLENRQKTKWDLYLPGSGMLMWHVNYVPEIWNGNIVNDNPELQYVDIIEADGLKDEESRSGDTFPGTAMITDIDINSHPDMDSFRHGEDLFSLTDIIETASGNLSLDCKTVSNVFTKTAPVILEASEINSDSFTARWLAVNKATDYRLNVYKIEKDVEDVRFEGFDEGAEKSDQWNTVLAGNMFNEDFCGENPPSVVFKQFGGEIESNEYLTDILGLKFWCKVKGGSPNKVGPSIMIYLLCNGEWTLYRTITLYGSAEGKIIEYDNLPEGTKKIKLRINGMHGMDCLIDDIELRYIADSKRSLLDGYPVLTGNVEEYTVSGLEANVVYTYNVEAFNGTDYSPSRES